MGRAVNEALFLWKT